MSEALVSFLVEQLGSIIFQQVEQNVRLVVNVKKEVATLALNLQTIQAVLADAERRQVKEANVRRWLNNLKEVSYEIDDVVDEWSTEILKKKIEKQGENAVVPKKKVCFSIPFHCLCNGPNGQVTQIIFRRDIAVRIKELNEKLALIHEQKKLYKFLQNETEQPERLKSFSIVDESGTFGRDYERNILVSQLVSENSEERKTPFVISIVGMGGIGKTTLAQLAYNDETVKDCFHTRIWVCVSEPFVQIAVAKDILEGLNKVTPPNSNELETFFQLISNSIKGKKFLLVLDDVWDSNHRKWEPFLTTLRCGDSGSRILVTTRITQVASTLGATSDHTIHLKELGEETCRSLFYHIAFFDGERKESKKFEDIGNEIVKRCKGLPLAAKTLGSLMRCKKTVQQWVDVLNSKIWELEVVEHEVFQPLFLSYHDLDPQSKCCLLYCTTFPKDHKIVKDQLIELWMSQDYLEVKGGNKEKRTVGQWCFENLVTGSFFQDIEEDSEGNIESCKMHNIMHDFVQYLTKDECFSMVVKGANERMELPGDEVRHLSLMFAPDQGPFPVSSLNCKRLRTLTAFESKLTSIGVELIRQLKSLRTLNLSRNLILEVPKEIGGLIHLRYLDLSYNEFLKELPDAVCDLYNLQTLVLVECRGLVRLPTAMGKLINLMHLYVWDCDKLRYLPKGIASLKSLQALDSCYVCEGDDKALKLGHLGIMDRPLRSLTIRLGNNSKDDASEIEKAQLGNKVHLFNLIVSFQEGAAEQRKGDEEIVKALQPHQNLKYLSILYCHGTTESLYWIKSLNKLRKVHLFDWQYCELLPPLGRLPSLEILEIQWMDSVKKVGVEFLGVQEEVSGILFPKLKHLSFRFMLNWEEWEGIIKDSSEITIMPMLSSLQIWYCPELKALPDFLYKIEELRTLTIGYCSILEREYEKGVGKEWHNISHIPNLTIG